VVGELFVVFVVTGGGWMMDDGVIGVVCFPSPYAAADVCVMGGCQTDCPSVLGHFVIYIYI
jgi:hypothetical protein